jgi:membrane protease YdiL (CAAX protease family)
MGTWASTVFFTTALAPRPSQKTRDLAEAALAFVMIESALWTTGPVQRVLTLAAALVIYALARESRWTTEEMGWRGLRDDTSQLLVAVGFVIAALIVAAAAWSGTLHGEFTAKNAFRFFGYGLWSMVQEFIVLGFLFTRLESCFGSRRAVVYSAALFAIAHVPNPVLMPVTLAGGLIVCEVYRRTRSLVPLGIVHWMIGVAIALSVPEGLLHRMRVGMGYLLYQLR